MRLAGAIALASVLLVSVAGCSTEVLTIPKGDAAADRPAGCSETICDVDFERCNSRPGELDGCTDCELDCQLVDSPAGYAACMSSCAYTCKAVGTSPPSCAEKLTSCRKTNANRGCVDGLERRYVPNVVLAWSYDSAWDCARAACAEFRAVCIELAQASVCMR